MKNHVASRFISAKLKSSTPITNVEHKICNKCGEDKDIKLFPKRSTNLDGRSNICNGCQYAQRSGRILRNKEENSRFNSMLI